MAFSLGLSEHFREKRRRISTRFHDEPRESEDEQHNQEREFQINVFNVALDKVISEIGRRFEKTKQVNNMFFPSCGISLESQAQATTKQQKELQKFVAKTFQTFIHVI